ncbi:uncharacterized protein [Miscanthus floridulus]
MPVPIVRAFGVLKKVHRRKRLLQRSRAATDAGGCSSRYIRSRSVICQTISVWHVGRIPSCEILAPPVRAVSSNDQPKCGQGDQGVASSSPPDAKPCLVDR